MVHFRLLCGAEDADRARSTCPSVADLLPPAPEGITAADEGVRCAFVCSDDRTACAVLTHAWPYDRNNVFVRGIAADTAPALRAMVAELRRFLDVNADVCPGLLLNARSVVRPPPGCPVSEVFRWFEG